MAEVAVPDVMGLCVADLGVWLDARDAGLRLVAPPGHAKFLQPQTAAGYGDLILRVRNEPLPQPQAWGAALCLSENWELWLDETGRYVFVAPRKSPPRRIVVDPGFTAGEVLGDFSSSDGDGLYPLQSLDIRLFANWLAKFGDVILHAAGVAVNGQGYCFAGSGGAGKSTLAALLSSASRSAAEAAATNTGAAVVLGEDQVILRFLEGRFWIYGTPWHVNPDLCAPLRVPLKKLFFLDRTAARGVAPCAALDGVARLLQTAFVPYYRPEAVSGILDRLALLAAEVPFYTLGYRLGTDAMELISEA